MENNKEFLKAMGLKMKLARVTKNTSLGRLGQLTGINRESISKMEKGKNNIHILNLKAIADALEVDIKDFL